MMCRPRLLVPLLAFTFSLSTAFAQSAAPVSGRLYFLSLSSGGRVASVNPDGSDLQILSMGKADGPDGISVDAQTKKIYWTNMGKVKLDDGSIQRMDLDGSNLTTVVPKGGTFTAKQMKLDAKHGKLYWSDREGMRIMRSNLDGSTIETLAVTGEGDDARKDAANWCVGMALDVEGGKVYWSQKGNGGDGRIFRANMEIPKGQTAKNRKDIEVLFDGLPEPIDIDLDLAHHMMYWADRGDPPQGNTVDRAPMDIPKGADPKHRTDQEILVRGLKEGIGITLDLHGGHMYYTDLSGSVYSANLDGSNSKAILTGQGFLTGITWVDSASAK
jgi:DNA-binding beta-propeller fold protein YncE